MIRVAKQVDISACAVLAAEVWPDESDSIGQKLCCEMRDQFSDCSSPPSFFVFESDGSIIGMAGYQRSMMSWDIYELTWVMVHPSQRRKSVGRALVEYTKDNIIIDDPSAKIIIFTTLVPAFYLKIGCETIREYTVDGEKHSIMFWWIGR